MSEENLLLGERERERKGERGKQIACALCERAFFYRYLKIYKCVGTSRSLLKRLQRFLITLQSVFHQNAFCSLSRCKYFTLVAHNQLKVTVNRELIFVVNFRLASRGEWRSSMRKFPWSLREILVHRLSRNDRILIWIVLLLNIWSAQRSKRPSRFIIQLRSRDLSEEYNSPCIYFRSYVTGIKIEIIWSAEN